jgi:hypothetical protein
VQKPLDSSQPGRSSSPLAGSRASFVTVPRGSVGPGSIAGTAISAATTAAGRPGSGAKSAMSGVSGVSGAKSKVSLASAISAGIVLAKDKLAQVRVRRACCAVAVLLRVGSCLSAFSPPRHSTCVFALQLQASLTPEKRLENEAERQRLKQLLLRQEAGVPASPDGSHRGSTSTSRASSAGAKPAGKAANIKGKQEASVSVAAPQVSMASISSSPAAVLSAEAGGQPAPRHGPVPPKIPALVSGHYLLDFGCVTKGINKSRKVKLTNMSTQQVRLHDCRLVPQTTAVDNSLSCLCKWCGPIATTPADRTRHAICVVPA